MVPARVGHLIEMDYTANGKESRRSNEGRLRDHERTTAQAAREFDAHRLRFRNSTGRAKSSGHTWATLDEAATLLYSQPHL
jgi:hypothetical protein